MSHARIDTHCHVSHGEEAPLGPAGDVLSAAAQVEQARAAGVTRLLDAGLHPGDFDPRFASYGHLPGVMFGAAIAPHDERSRLSDLDALVRILESGRACALSEIGLDLHHRHDDFDVQKDVFDAQLRIAKERDLAVFLHLRSGEGRDVWKTAVEMVGASGHRRGAVHCFTGGWEEARAFLDLGFHLSFSGIVTFKNALALQDVARRTPRDRLLTETDAPWLAPVPHRGKRNRSAWIPHVNAFLATLRGESLDGTEAALYANARSLIGFQDDATTA